MKLSDIEITEIEQPDSVEFHLADDVFIKSGSFSKENTVIPQHSHEYDHTSFIARGSVRAWCEDEYLGVFNAPCSIFIKAHAKHTFQTLEPETLILCIHNISRNGLVDIHELHELTLP